MRKQVVKYVLYPVLLIGMVWEVFGVPTKFKIAQVIRNEVSGDSIDSITLSQNIQEFEDIRSLRSDSVWSSRRDSLRLERERRFTEYNDSTLMDSTLMDSTMLYDSLAADTLKSVSKKSFLEAPIYGKNKDSLIYDVDNKTIYIFGEGDVKYEKIGLQAEYITMNTDNKMVYARGTYEQGGGSGGGSQSVVGGGLKGDGDVKHDSLGAEIKYKKPIFTEGQATYEVDSIDYNMDSQQAYIIGVRTQEGEGFLFGGEVKKMKDNVIHMHNGRYTTCDADCPHFYLQMTKGTVIPNKKTVFGPAYMVFEDVPIYFLGLPFGFFPQSTERKSGFIFPEIGEEMSRGFFLRNGGYYFAINDNVDLRLVGGIYTLGSWEVGAASNYKKKYKYDGSVSFNYSSVVMGDQGSTDFGNSKNMKLVWSHRQDPKASPGTTFSASVDYSTSSYNKTSSQLSPDYLNSQANSTVSYQRSWAGTPFSLSITGSMAQSIRDSTYQFNLPNITFNVSRVSPFKRKIQIGKERWYEKINFTYGMTFNNNTGKVKEEDLFSQQMLDQMTYSVSHKLPISTSFNLFQYLNITPGINYSENWIFKREEKHWDATNNVLVSDTVRGFNRVYDYSGSIGLTTNLYGMYTIGRTTEKLISIRHVLTPNISVSYHPGFGQFYREVRTTDPKKPVVIYSPYTGHTNVPSRDMSASINFGFNNTLEMKTPSRKDTTGFAKTKILERFSINSSYDFAKDSLKLAVFNVNAGTTIFKGFSINVAAIFDPYQINNEGVRINQFQIKKGGLARLTSFSTGAGYTFSGGKGSGSSNAMNSPEGMRAQGMEEVAQQGFFDQRDDDVMNERDRALMMANRYYDFTIPWSIGFDYSFSYTKTGLKPQIMQTLNFRGNANITEKWGVSFNAGYDFEKGKISNASVNISRDLHCWHMTFSWIPVGVHQQWHFTIQAKSSMLADLLKWEKRTSPYDNY